MHVSSKYVETNFHLASKYNIFIRGVLLGLQEKLNNWGQININFVNQNNGLLIL